MRMLGVMLVRLYERALRAHPRPFTFELALPDYLELSLNIPRTDMAQNTSSAGTNRPKARQRRHKSPPPIDVPDIDQDAAERKRLLNVLAQRRYRECNSK